MGKKRWEQIGAASGILFLILQFSAQGLIQVGGAEPSFNASAEEILAYFLRRDPQLFNIGGILSVFSFIAFLLFLGVLWGRLHSSEDKPAWMSLIAFGSGLLSGAIIMGIGGAGGWTLAMFRIEESLSPEMARLIFDMGNLSFATYWVGLACLLLFSSVVTIRDGAFPSWLGWFGAATALLLLVARIFWDLPSGVIFVPYVLFSLWLIITSVILFRKAGENG